MLPDESSTCLTINKNIFTKINTNILHRYCTIDMEIGILHKLVAYPNSIDHQNIENYVHRITTKCWFLPKHGVPLSETIKQICTWYIKRKFRISNKCTYLSIYLPIIYWLLDDIVRWIRLEFRDLLWFYHKKLLFVSERNHHEGDRLMFFRLFSPVLPKLG